MRIRSITFIRTQGISSPLSVTVNAAVTKSSVRPSESALVAATTARSADCTPYRRMVVNSAFCPTIRYAVTSIPAAHSTNTFAVMPGTSQESDRQREKRETQRNRDELRNAEQTELGVRALGERHRDGQQQDLPGPRERGDDDRAGRDTRGHADRQEEIHEQRHVQQFLQRRRPLDQSP